MYFRITLHIPIRYLHTLTPTPSPAAPSTRNTRISHHHHLTEGAGRIKTPCLLSHFQVHMQISHILTFKRETNTYLIKKKKNQNHSKQPVSPNFCIYISFLLCRKEEGAVVPVPVRDAPDTIDAELYLVGPVICRHVSILLTKQRAPGAAVGPPEGQPQNHDLPEDGTGTEKLFPHWRDSEGEEEAHLQVQWEDTERPTRRCQRGVGGMVKRVYMHWNRTEVQGGYSEKINGCCISVPLCWF